MQYVLKKDSINDIGVWGILAALGILGCVLVLLCTWRYGAGVSPDSTCYISVAKNLLAGQGYRTFDGSPCSQWPPLFPVSMAAFGLVGIEPQTAARFLNAVAFGLLIFVSGKMFVRCTTSPALALLGTLSIVLSAPLISASGYVWSEAVFIFLAALFILLLANFLHAGSWRSLVLVSIVAALGCLQRYVGVTLILAGGILILLYASQTSVWQRLKYAVSFGMISGTPLAAWILRNRIVSGVPTGSHRFHLASTMELHRSGAAAADVVAGWFLPEMFSPAVEAVGLTLILLLASAAIVLPGRILKDRDGLRAVQIRVVAVFAAVFCAFLVLSGAGLRWNPDGRVMLPAYVFLMLLVFTGIDVVSRLGERWIGRRPSRWAGLLLCSAWLISFPLGRAATCVKYCVKDGAGGYCSHTWMESPVIAWLRVHPLSGTIYTNIPDALYALTGGSARRMPCYWEDLGDFADGMSSSGASYIVWLGQIRLDQFYDLRELRSRWRMTEIATFSDGAVWQFLGDGDDIGVHGVYRFWRSQESNHLYTCNRREVEAISLYHVGQWHNEGIVFYVYSEAQHPPDTLPVYEFCSNVSQTRFYTISEKERDYLLREYSHVWRYEGVAWYAYPEGRQPADSLPVYRFWCGRTQAHFYTISEIEKDVLLREMPDIWTYEGVVWYAYGK